MYLIILTLSKRIMSKRKYGRLFNIIAISLSVGILIGYAGNNKDVLGLLDDYFKPQVTRGVNPVLIGSGEVATCFTPPSGCGTVIANLISRAEKSIYVQAYGFTSGEIAKALINASNRGVKVRVLLDKSNIGAKYSKMRDLRKAGIEVLIDEISGIAHNKTIIIDASLMSLVLGLNPSPFRRQEASVDQVERKFCVSKLRTLQLTADGCSVITGSFNFTTSADIRNTENVIMIRDKQVAQRYLQNWFARYEISHARITKKQ